MQRIVLLAAMVIALATNTTAQQWPSRDYSSLGNQTLEVGATVTTFDAELVRLGSRRAELVVFDVECVTGASCDLRYWDDGTAPTPTSGRRLRGGATYVVAGHDNIRRFRVVREGEHSASLVASFYR